MGRDKINKFILDICVMAVLLFVATNLMSYLRKPTLHTNLVPTQSFKLIDGTTYTPAHAKPLLIHFWATWCKVCALETSNIEHISQNYEVLTIVTQSGDDNNIKAYMQQHRLDFKVMNDSNGNLAKVFHVEAFPTDFVYSSDGTLLSTDVGYTTTVGLLARMKLAL